MIECAHRIMITVEKTEKPNDGIGKAATWAVEPTFAFAVAGQLGQTFKHGLCRLLTVNDIGPMECRQPNSNQKNCPDIKGLE